MCIITDVSEAHQAPAASLGLVGGSAEVRLLHSLGGALAPVLDLAGPGLQ